MHIEYFLFCLKVLYIKFVPVLNPGKDKRFKTAQKNKFQQNEHKENGKRIIKIE